LDQNKPEDIVGALRRAIQKVKAGQPAFLIDTITQKR
jgi:hypothetical protein